MSESDAPIVELKAWTGPWNADDPDANLKADVAVNESGCTQGQRLASRSDLH